MKLHNLMSLSLLVVTSTVLHAAHQTGSVNHIGSQKEMDALLKSGKAAIVKFEADWCGPCKASRSPFAKMAENHTDVLFASVNVDHAKAVGNKYKVSSLPTFIIFDPNGKQMAKITGFNSTDLLKAIKPFESTSDAPAKKKEQTKKVKPKKTAQKETKQPEKTTTKKQPKKAAKKCPTGKVVTPKDEDHFNDMVSSGGIVVAKFEAEWCAPCKEAAEPFGYIVGDYPDVTFIEVDIDDHKDIMRANGVKNVPTFVIFKDGSEADRMVSFFDPALRAKIDDVKSGKKSPMAQVNIVDRPEVS